MKSNIKLLLISLSISLVFAASYSTLAVRKYDAHQTRGNLSAYAQSLWNTLHGNFMSSTFNYSVHNFWGNHFDPIDPSRSSIFGIHFSPVIITLVPLYVLSPHPQTLLIIQSVFFALSSVIIYALALKLLNNSLIALVIQISYLSNLAIVSASLSEFNAYPLSVLFSALLILTSYWGKSYWYYLSLLSLLMVQENAAIPVIFFGVYLALGRKNYFRGLLTIITSLTALLLVIKLIIPQISPYGKYLFENYYGTNLGSSFPQMIFNSVQNPQLLLTALINKENVLYLSKLLLPVIPIVLLSPLALITGSLSLLPNLISSSSILKSLSMYYEAASTPYIYYALILGCAYFLTLYRRIAGVIILSLLIILPVTLQYKTLTNHIFSPRCIWSCQFYDQRDMEIDEMLSGVLEGSSVSTQDFLTGHLTNRRELYLFPVAYQEVEFLPLSKGDEIWPLEPEHHLRLLQELYNSPSHKVIFESEHYVLFKKS